MSYLCRHFIFFLALLLSPLTIPFFQSSSRAHSITPSAAAAEEASSFNTVARAAMLLFRQIHGIINDIASRIRSRNRQPSASWSRALPARLVQAYSAPYLANAPANTPLVELGSLLRDLSPIVLAADVDASVDRASLPAIAKLLSAVDALVLANDGEEGLVSATAAHGGYSTSSSSDWLRQEAQRVIDRLKLLQPLDEALVNGDQETEASISQELDLIAQDADVAAAATVRGVALLSEEEASLAETLPSRRNSSLVKPTTRRSTNTNTNAAPSLSASMTRGVSVVRRPSSSSYARAPPTASEGRGFSAAPVSTAVSRSSAAAPISHRPWNPPGPNSSHQQQQQLQQQRRVQDISSAYGTSATPHARNVRPSSASSAASRVRPVKSSTSSFSRPSPVAHAAASSSSANFDDNDENEQEAFGHRGVNLVPEAWETSTAPQSASASVPSLSRPRSLSTSSVAAPTASPNDLLVTTLTQAVLTQQRQHDDQRDALLKRAEEALAKAADDRNALLTSQLQAQQQQLAVITQQMTSLQQHVLSSAALQQQQQTSPLIEAHAQLMLQNQQTQTQLLMALLAQSMPRATPVANALQFQQQQQQQQFPASTYAPVIGTMTMSAAPQHRSTPTPLSRALTPSSSSSSSSTSTSLNQPEPFSSHRGVDLSALGAIAKSTPTTSTSASSSAASSKTPTPVKGGALTGTAFPHRFASVPGLAGRIAAGGSIAKTRNVDLSKGLTLSDKLGLGSKQR